MVQLVFECGEFLFVTIVCAEVIRILIGDTLHFGRVCFRKGVLAMYNLKRGLLSRAGRMLGISRVCRTDGGKWK